MGCHAPLACRKFACAENTPVLPDLDNTSGGIVMTYAFTHLVDCCRDTWQAYIQHDFVSQLGDATLPAAAFRHYLQQDYLFLIQFSRAYALAAYKSRTLADLRHAKTMLQTIVDDEMRLHIDYCAEWGID